MNTTAKIFSFSGRLLMGLPYLVFGIAHFVRHEQFRSTQPEWMGGHVIWVYLFGTIMIACALSILTGKMGRIGALTLALMVLLLTIGLQLPKITSGDADTLTAGIEGIAKNTGLIGGYLFYAAYARAGWK